jgi:hypothetical protein
MIEMLRIYSKGFLENATIERLPLMPFFSRVYPVADMGVTSFSSLPSSRSSATSNS